MTEARIVDARHNNIKAYEENENVLKECKQRKRNFISNSNLCVWHIKIKKTLRYNPKYINFTFT